MDELTGTKELATPPHAVQANCHTLYAKHAHLHLLTFACREIISHGLTPPSPVQEGDEVSQW